MCIVADKGFKQVSCCLRHVHIMCFHGKLKTILKIAMYSKTGVKQLLKKDKSKILMANGSLMKVGSIAECYPLEHSAILLTCLKR